MNKRKHLYLSAFAAIGLVLTLMFQNMGPLAAKNRVFNGGSTGAKTKFN